MKSAQPVFIIYLHEKKDVLLLHKFLEDCESTEPLFSQDLFLDVVGTRKKCTHFPAQ